MLFVDVNKYSMRVDVDATILWSEQIGRVPCTDVRVLCKVYTIE